MTAANFVLRFEYVSPNGVKLKKPAGFRRLFHPSKDSRRQNPLPKSASRFGATSKSVRTGGDSNKPCRPVVLNTPNQLMSRGIYHHSTLPREPCPALQNFADASIVREQRGSDQLGPKIYCFSRKEVFNLKNLIYSI